MRALTHQRLNRDALFPARVLALALLVLLLLLALACTKDSTGPDRSKTELDRNLIVLDSLSGITVTSTTDNSLTIEFPGDPPDINRWNLLASSKDGGFLRSISTIRTSDNSMTIETERAALTGAVVSGSSDTTLTLSFIGLSSDQPSSPADGRLAAGATVGQGQITLDGLNLFSGQIGGTNLDLTVLSGHIDFKPLYRSSFQISDRQLIDYLVSLSGQLGFAVDVQLSNDGPIIFDRQFELASFRYDIVRYIGALPITESITLALDAGFEVSATQAGQSELTVASNDLYQAGGEYADGQWGTLWSTQVNPGEYQQHPLQNGNVTLRVHVRPHVTVTYYGMAGGVIGIEPYHVLTSDSSSEATWAWSIRSGLQGSVSEVLRPFDGSNAPFIESLPDTSVLVGSDQVEACAAPQIPSTPAPPDGDSLTASPPAFVWASDTLATHYSTLLDGSLECNSITDTTCEINGSLDQGMHTWQVIAMNDCDTVPGPVWSFTVACPAPATPTEPDPPNGANLSGSPAELAWSAANGATSYTVMLDGEVVCEDVESTSCSVEMELAPGAHSWHVIATNECGTTDGPTWSFSINCPLPEAPSYISPANGDTVGAGSYALTWSSASGAAMYDVYFDDALRCQDLENLSCQTPLLVEGSDEHSWRVVAKNACGEISGPTWTFLICETADTPTGPDPVDFDTLSESPARLAWRKTPGAVSYDVRLDDALICEQLEDTVCQAIPLLSEGDHTWQVIAHGTCGATLGPTWLFNVCVPPAAPTNPVPANGENLTESPTVLDWATTQGALLYDVYVDDALTCSNISVSECNLGATLESGSHHWYVVAHGVCASTTSNVWTFSVSCPLPALPSNPAPPDHGILSSPPLSLTWADDPTATSYDVRLDGALVCTGTTNTQCEITGELDDGAHTWQVISRNECGDVTGDVWSFDVCPPLDPPGSPNPADDAALTSSPALLDWGTVIGALDYDVVVDGDTVCAHTSASSCTLPLVLDAGAHTWQVFANGACDTTVSPVWRFSLCAAPGSVTNPAPANGDSLSATTTFLGWTLAEGAIGYNVWLDGNLVCEDLNQGICNLSGELEIGDHAWRVDAYNSCDTTIGPTWTFTVCPPPGPPTVPVPINGANLGEAPAVLDWADSPEASTYDVYVDSTLECTGITNSQCTITRSLSTGTHRWQVIAHNPCGQYPGALWSFSIDCPLPAEPSQPSPADMDTIAASPTLLDWADAAGADKYEVRIDGLLACVDVTVSECALGVTLDAGPHTLQVTAKNDCGSVVGPDWTFTICPPPGTPTTPLPAEGDTLSSTPASLDWNDVIDVDSYDVLLNGTPACSGSVLSECAVAGPLSAGNYTWQVIARNACDSTLSPVWHFTICDSPATPASPNPVDYDTSSTAPTVLDWGDALGADTYDLYFDGGPVCVGTGVSTCTLGAAPAVGDHTWQVIARNDCDTTVGPVWHFSVCAAPSNPATPTPATGDTLAAAPLTLDWVDTPGALSYDVLLDGSLECSGIGGSECLVVTSLSDTLHTWQVIARNDCDSTVGPEWTFTICTPPGNPTNPIPAQLDTLSSSPVSLDWDDVPAATWYRVRLGGATECDSVAVSACTLAAPLTAGDYDWQVVAFNACDSVAGPTWTFTICDPPSAPLTPQPPDGDTLLSSPTLLDWGDAAGATTYDVYLDGALECSGEISSQCTVSGSLITGDYTWYVVAHNACDSTVSDSWTFTVCTPPDTAANPAPLDGDTLSASPVALDWDDVPGTDTYDVLLNGSFECTGSAVSACTLSVPLVAGDYTWQVIARNVCDSTVGPLWGFTICDPPSTPATPTPATNDTSSTAPTLLNWDDTPGATSYDVRVDGGLVCIGNTASQCSLISTPTTGLHTWQVIAHNDCDSTLGPVWNFTVCDSPSTPSGPVPAVDDTVSAAPTTLNWDDTPNATSYDVLLNGSPECVGVGVSECTVVSSLTAGDYTWQVIARNDCDSTVGAAWTFTVCDPPASPANPVPADGDSASSAPTLLDWDDAIGALSYDVFLDGSLECVAETTSACTVVTVLSSGDHTWQVIARNDCDSTVGTTWTFTICDPPDTAATPSPADSDSLTVAPTILDWGDVVGADTYDVLLDGAPECTDLGISECTIGTLLTDGDHTWQVIARNACDSTAGPVWQFNLTTVVR